VTIAGALSTPGAGQPVSCTRYVKLTGPVTPGGGVKRNEPSAAATIEPPKGLVVLMLPGVIVNVVETHPLTPLSAASETPESKPTPAGMAIGMLACAEKLLFVTVGGSLTALTVIVNVWSPELSTPPLAVPPSSCAWYVIVAAPFWFGAAVYVSVPVGE